MTTGIIKYIDFASSIDANGVRVKPWSKVDCEQSSVSRSERNCFIANIRDVADSFGVDVSGFDVFTYPSKHVDFTDDTEICNSYYPETETLLRERIPGIKKVIIFHHAVRKRDKSSPRQPILQLHVDQTPDAAEVRARRFTNPDETEELLKGRYQIINVWRPIGHPASDFPLAVMDWRTISPEEDMMGVDVLYPKVDNADDYDNGKKSRPEESTFLSTEGYEVKGEIYAVTPKADHRFYYVKDMTPDEVLLIKCFDSGSQGQPGGKEGVAGLTPHTAFEDPATPADAKGRESIEVRCLIFH